MSDNSILAVDFGSVTTRASLIDLVEGVYRIVATAKTPTTAGFPFGDVGIGFRRALMQLTEATNRPLLTQDGRVITPEQIDRSGVDALVATASIGRPLKTAVVGIFPDMSITSAIRAANGTYTEIIATISVTDGRDEDDRLNTLIAADPDLILLTGGIEGGARQPVIDLAYITYDALRLTTRDPKPVVVYAGNTALIPQIDAILGGITQVFYAPNVRPSLDDEVLDGAQRQLAYAFDAYTSQRGLGFDNIAYMTRTGVMPAGISYQTLIDLLGRERGGRANVLALDLGSSVSTLSASVKGVATTNIRTDIGMGASATPLLRAIGRDAIRAWLPFYASDDEIDAYVLNKGLRPATIPELHRTLYLEHAVARAAIKTLLAAARPTWTPDTALDDPNQPLPPFERIFAAGATLADTGRPGMTAMLLLDALEPPGVTDLVVDRDALIAALGAIAQINADAAVHLLETGFERLGTVVSFGGQPRKGAVVARVQVQSADGDMKEYAINGGDLTLIPLPIGVITRVRVRGALGASIGGQRSVRFETEGGSAGLIIDARGRPLPLATTLRERADQLIRWYAQATGDTPFIIPDEWLTPVVATAAAQEIPLTVDRRSTKAEKRAAKVEKRGRRRGKNADADSNDDDLDALFGDNSRSSDPSTQDDEDELRKLFP